MRLHPALSIAFVLACGKTATPTAASPASTPPPSQAPAASAPAPSEPAAAAPAGKSLTAGGVRFVPPPGWSVEQPSSPMRLHQLRIPAAPGADSAVVTVSTAGGDVDSNLERWRRQFEGKPEEARADSTPSGIAVTSLTLTGTYLDKPAPMAPGPGTPRPGWTMRGLVVQGPNGLVFVKGWGPAPTLAAAAPAFDSLIASITKE